MLGGVARAFNSSTLGAEDVCDFKANLVYTGKFQANQGYTGETLFQNKEIKRVASD